jgi:hypothetical protein
MNMISGVLVTIYGILIGENRFIYTLYNQLVLTSITALSLVYSIYSLLLHMHKDSQSSLVVPP